MNSRIVIYISIASIAIAVLAVAIALNSLNQSTNSMEQVQSLLPSASPSLLPTLAPMQVNPPFNVTFQEMQASEDGTKSYIAHISLNTNFDLQNLTVLRQHAEPIENGVSYRTEIIMEKEIWDGTAFTVDIKVPPSEKLCAPLIINWFGGSKTFDFPREMYPPSVTFPNFNVTFELIPKLANETRDYDVYHVHISLPTKLTLQSVDVAQWSSNGYYRNGNKAWAVQPLIPDYVVKFPNNVEPYFNIPVWDGSEFVVRINVGKFSEATGDLTGEKAVRITWMGGPTGGKTFGVGGPEEK